MLKHWGLLNGEAEMLTIRLCGIRKFEKNQKITLNFPVEHIHLFDIESHKRILN